MLAVSYDPQRRALKVQLDGKSVAIEGLSGEPTFRRQAPGKPEETALWLERGQAEVLVKMIEYILAKVKISEPSRRTLEAVLPEVQRLARGQGGAAPEQAPDQTAEPTAEQTAEAPSAEPS